MAVFVSVFLIATLALNVAAATSGDDKKQSLQIQIDALEREASQIDANLQEVKRESTTLAREVSIFDNEIKKRQLEQKRINLAIRQAEVDIATKAGEIEETIRDVEQKRQILADNLRRLYSYDQENLVVVLAKNASISSFFRVVDAIRTMQANISELVENLRASRLNLELEKEELEEFREDQQSLKALLEIERRNIEVQRAEKDRLLKLTKGKESIFQNLLSAKKLDITTLKTQLFYLERTGVTAEDAVRFTTLAAERAGIRPAFLLALLEIETGRRFEGDVVTAGTNLGTGSWRADMKPNQHTAFIAITAKLNLDPDKMPVSARPCAKSVRERIGPGKPCGYGWGGAMGPAQFIPTTWLLFEEKVARLTGHNPPNPWNIEDAFTASAIFLAESGATSKTQAGETRAAKTYLSGRPSCTSYSCRAYANSILSLASRLERII